MRSQTERAEPATTSLRYLMVAFMQVHARKFRERLPRACAYLVKLVLLPLCVSIDLCPCTSPSVGVCGGPLFAPPSTSARVQSRFEFVKLGTYICALIPQESLGLQAGTKHYIRKHSMYVPSIYGMYRYQRFTCRIRMDI